MFSTDVAHLASHELKLLTEVSVESTMWDFWLEPDRPPAPPSRPFLINHITQITSTKCVTTLVSPVVGAAGAVSVDT